MKQRVPHPVRLFLCVGLWAALAGCPLFVEEKEEEPEDPYTYAPPPEENILVWKKDFDSMEMWEHPIHDGVVYVAREDEGVRAIRLSDGTELWHNADAIPVKARPCFWGDYLYVFKKYEGEIFEQKAVLFRIRLNDGFTERVTISDDLADTVNAYNYIQNGSKLYYGDFGVQETGALLVGLSHRGVLRLDLDGIYTNAGELRVDAEVVYSMNRRVTNAMDIAGDVMVFTSVPPGYFGYPTGQELYEVTAIDVATGQKKWTVQPPEIFLSATYGPWGVEIREDKVLIGSLWDITALSLDDGRVVWSHKENIACKGEGFSYYRDGISYMTRGLAPSEVPGNPYNVFGIRVSDGAVVWKKSIDKPDVRLGYSPAAYGDRLFVASGFHLTAFDIPSGKVLYSDKSVYSYSFQVSNGISYWDKYLIVPAPNALFCVDMSKGVVEK